MGRLVLVIDDEPDIRELLQITLQRMAIDSHCVADLKTARKLLKEHDFDLCLTDMRLPDGDGVEFVNEIQREFPQIPVAVITAHGSIDSAIQALKYGAFDFLTKPVDLNSLRIIVQGALKIQPDREAIKPAIIGDSPAITAVRKTIEKVARSQAPIYISGESGTGKELAARMIHDYGPRSEQPFVPINCGAIPAELMESEFFGHLKGSFTGAVSDKNGLFQAAHGGTLFLDEIAELPPHMQVKLLRAIQEKVVRPIGSRNEFSVDVRILSATNRDLNEQVRQGLFRQDLLYRINVIELQLPPLRERAGDIPLLIAHLLDRMAAQPGNKSFRLEAAAEEKLANYHYPGNIRELENILERASTLSGNAVIGAADIQLMETKSGAQDRPEPALNSALLELEREKIVNALEQTRWNKTAAAKYLGISLRALRYRVKKYNIK